MAVTLRLLSQFLAVVEERNLSRAAARLGMSQPPLSLAMKGLEGEVGATLLRRVPKGVEPTPAGEALAEEARAVVERLEAGLTHVRRVARGEAGRLAIGFTSSLIEHFGVHAALRAFKAERPDVHLSLDEDSTVRLEEKVADEALDAAFVRARASRTRGVTVTPLGEEEIRLAVPLGWPQGEDGVPFRLADAGPLPFVLYRRSTSPGLYDEIVAACRNEGVVPDVVQEAPRVGATLNLVAAGLGVTIVPLSMCQTHREAIAYRPLVASRVLLAPLGLARQSATPSPALATFARVVARTFEAALGTPSGRQRLMGHAPKEDDTMANDDQAKGKGKDLGGKLKEEAGDLSGNDKMKREGQADQVEGKVQKGVGDVKDKVNKS